MPTATKEQTDVMEGIKALRDLVHGKHEKTDATVKEIQEGVDKFLDDQESKNQQYLTDLKSSEEKAAETQSRLDALEIDVATRSEKGEKNYKETNEYKALQAFALKGDQGLYDMDAETKATLRTDVDTQGGYLVVGEMDNTITKLITEISGLRSVSRVRTIGKKTLDMAIRTAIPTAAYEGEAEQGGESNSVYGSESLTAFRLSVTIPITLDMLMDSSFNMESEIFGDAAEAFAQKEGNKFILGTNSKQPEGILTNTAVVAGARTGLGASGLIIADDVILLTGDLKTGYNPTYVLNRATLAYLRTLKSTTGDFLWQPGMNGPVSNTMNGFSYVLAQDMPAMASNSLSIAFGDFQRGYTIIDRTGVSMVRDEFTSKKNAIVEFTIHRWNYGKVVVPEAITLLKTAA